MCYKMNVYYVLLTVFISSNLKQCNVLFFLHGLQWVFLPGTSGRKNNADSFYLIQKKIYNIHKFPGFFVCLDDRVQGFFYSEIALLNT